MPNPESFPTGAPCWIDLMTSDPDASKAFYGQLFGWTAEDGGPEFGGYVTFLKDGSGVAGCMKSDPNSDPPGPSDVWSVYLTVDDVKATADAVVANGGQVVVPPMDVMDLGVMAFATDVGGAAIGLWQPGSHKGFGVLAEPGAPAWFELHTHDYDATVDFYRTVFGWDAHVAGDTPDFRYTTLGQGEAQAAGIMDASGFLPEGVPAHWSIYFSVPDADAALDTVVALGGSVVMPAEDTPYGRLASVADPNGASFKLVAG